jgi:hypothetical protein
MKSKNTSSKKESLKSNGSSKRAASASGKTVSRSQLSDGSIRNSEVKNGHSPADAKMLRAWETINKNRGETKGVRG